MAKILLLDDSVTFRAQIRRSLLQHGHEIVEGGNGQDGLNAMKVKNDFDIIVTDVNMPIMGGLYMCQILTEQNLLNNIPIIVISTESSVELKAKGKAFGVVGWLVKPFSDDKFLSALNAVLEKFHK